MDLKGSSFKPFGRPPRPLRQGSQTGARSPLLQDTPKTAPPWAGVGPSTLDNSGKETLVSGSRDSRGASSPAPARRLSRPLLAVSLLMARVGVERVHPRPIPAAWLK